MGPRGLCKQTSKGTIRTLDKASKIQQDLVFKLIKSFFVCAKVIKSS